MTHRRYIVAASVVACLYGGVAVAQSTSAPPSASLIAPPALQVAPPALQVSAPAAVDRANLASATAAEPANATVSVTVDANGDRHLVVSSPPVPDTPENRAQFGQPLSAAGRHTLPAGN
jgi:hypothetical protein